MKSFNSKLYVNQVLTIALISFLYMILSDGLFAQNVAITDDDGYTVNAAAMLDVKSVNKGLLVPRVALVSTTDPISVTKPAGLLVWNTSTSGSYPDPGFYYWSGSNWVKVGSSALDFQDGLIKTGNIVSHEDLSSQASINNSNGTVIQDVSLGSLGHITGLGSYNLDNRYYTETEVDNLISGEILWDENSGRIYPVTLSNDVGIGTNAPLHKLHVVENVNIIDGTDGNFLDIQNSNASYDVMSGIRFQNGTSTNTFKGGIFYRDTLSWGRGDMIFANNPVGSSGNVTFGDARMVIRNEGKVEILGNPAADVDDPLLEVRNKDGELVFGVYNEGVRIYVSDAPGKGLKGGFAVGGFNSSKGITNEYLRITPDTFRIYVDDTGTGGKGLKGGFAVGGFGSSKGLTNEYFRVSPDSVRIYVDNDPETKGLKGGFAVGGFNSSKGYENAINFMDITPENYFIGHESGQKITNGEYNTFFGFEAGYSTEGGIEVSPGQWEGCNNIFIGYQSGYDNITGYKNVFIGYKSGANNTSGEKNIFIGNASGEFNTTGGYNSFIGYNAGIVNSTGIGNTFLGSNCGFYNSTGAFNTCLGSHTGEYLDACSANTFIGTYSGHGGGFPGSYPSTKITGNYNTFLGYRSGFDNLSGSNNTYLGYQSGHGNASGSGNVFIGSEAGYNEAGSNKLYIDNTNTTTPLIYGDFASDVLRFNANVGIGSTSTSAKLYVNGTGNESAIRTYNTDNSGNNYGIIAYAGSTGTNNARAIYSRVYRSGSGTYYSGYFLDYGTGGTYEGLYADYRTGDAIDLAEYIYDTYNNLEKADVVVIDKNNDESVVHNSEPYSANVAGIVSTKPHLVMGMELIKDEETGEEIPGVNAVQLSLAGRVPVKVTDENGPIKRGDFLTSSSIPGYAMKWTLLDVNEAKNFEGLKIILAENERRRNAVIGKALEEHISGTGKIVVLIGLQ
ncbi:MAG: hypothetical protein J7K53_09965 [Bacteroidales bacterium]|nr:hypothetical protein [Bacteroidales bacterium]